jgi:RNA polymerase sigma-70 factor, ECF subfamily
VRGFEVPRAGEHEPRSASAAAAEDGRWLADLRASGARREEAVGRLHAVLLRAARFEVHRRRSTAAHIPYAELDDLALQAADDALMAVLRKLDDYRGASRFTTWAYKFALYEAAVKVRRNAWRGREVALEPEAWPIDTAEPSPQPDAEAETGELLRAVREEIDGSLTPHQRQVLVALALNGVPIDVLAERLNTTRGALYKTLHDARRKLRAELAERGFAVGAREEVKG